MVRVASITTNDADMTAKVSLEADTKAEMTNISTDDIIGFPKGYKMDFFSDVTTSALEIGILQSDGTWNWGD